MGNTFGNAFVGQGAPRITSLSPSRGPTDEATEVIMRGSDFPADQADVLAVVVGGRAASSVRIAQELSDADGTPIVAVFPVGAGASLDVRLLLRTVNSSAVRLWSYEEPEVTQVMPREIFAGETNLRLDIVGSNFGSESSHVRTITIVSVIDPSSFAECSGDVVWHSASRLSCTVSLVPDSMPHGDVQAVVVVAGQTSRSVSTGQSPYVLGQPIISTISPRSAAGNGSILILGERFGNGPEDILSVTVDGEACLSWFRRGQTAILCTVPFESEARKAAGEIDTSALVGLDVSVRTRGGLRSEENQEFGYASASDEPFNSPFAVVGYREQNSLSLVKLRWMYTD